MPQIQKLTPNLLVVDVARSVSYYTEVLGFTRAMTVPEEAPFVFASVTSGGVEIFFNDAAHAVKEYSAFAGRPIGISGTMFIEVKGLDEFYAQLQGTVTIAIPLVTQWYGMKEFAIADPDGYLITFAERAEQA